MKICCIPTLRELVIHNQHTKYFNEINRIKAESLDLDREQRFRVQDLENKQKQIMEQIKNLFN